MNIAITSIQAKLYMLALVCISLVSFTACSNNDGPVEEVTYSWGFADLSASSPDFMDDINNIESTFRSALGATGTATSLTKQGTPETCDQEVLEACNQALESLKGNVWQGHYTFIVTNVTTGTVIFTHTFDANNENSGESYLASDLKFGDYYYSDGTWSDGGLRGINYSDNTMEWSKPRPEPLSGKTVIGMVFQAGHYLYDYSDYSHSGIVQTKCRGYAVALQDANDNYCKWGRDDISLGLYHHADGIVWNNFKYPNTDWSGYSYTQTIIEAAGGKNKLNAEKVTGYPATYYAVVKYETSCPAPRNSSGWFLPSIGQLLEVCYRKADLFGSTESSGFKAEDYWSSSELWDRPEFTALRVLVDYSGIANNYGLSCLVSGMGKESITGRPIYVRPVLAF